MKPGCLVRLTAHELDAAGAGVGTSHPTNEDAVPVEVHVLGALPGEDVAARVEHVSSREPIAWATLHTVHTPSPSRVAPRCVAYGQCGGCILQHLDVDEQLAWKVTSLRRLFKGHPELARAPFAAAVASPLAFGYRNNSKLVAARDSAGRLMLGAYAPRSHQVVNLAGCAVTEAPLEDVARGLGDILRANGVEPYDERHLVGTLRYAILRANARCQVLLTLVTASDTFVAAPAIVETLRARHPCVVGVVQNVNTSRGNALYGPRTRILAGAGTIEDEVGDVRVRLSAGAFFQANRRVAATAYRAICEGVEPLGQDAVVDAYAGVGGISLTIARKVRSVVGVEVNPAAVADAIASAALNGISNTRFVAGDVSREFPELTRADIVVLNPPRKGCAPEVLDRTTRLQPRTIAYLSCGPSTLVRDLAFLSDRGYVPRQVTPLDMLPHTTHIEVLVILARSPHERRREVRP